MMAGIVELAVVESLSAERPADENKRRARQAQRFGLGTDIAERAAYHFFVRPAYPVSNGDGTLGAVMWN